MLKKSLIFLSALFIFAGLSMAQTTTTWTGQGSVAYDRWSDPDNWSNGVPASGTTQPIYLPGGYPYDNFPSLYDNYTLRSNLVMDAGEFGFNQFFVDNGGTFDQRGGNLGPTGDIRLSGAGTNGTWNISGNSTSYLSSITAGNTSGIGYVNVFGDSYLEAQSMYLGVHGGEGQLDVHSRAYISLQLLIGDEDGGKGTATVRSGILTAQNIIAYNGNVQVLGGTLASLRDSVIGRNGKAGLEVSAGIFHTATMLSVGQLQYGSAIAAYGIVDEDFNSLADAHGIANQTGGYVFTRNMEFANVMFNERSVVGTDDFVIGTYNHSGGILEAGRVSSGVLHFSSLPNDNVFTNAVTFRAEWNISGNANIRVFSEEDGHYQSGIYGGSVLLSLGKGVNDSSKLPTGTTYQSVVNVTGGNIKVDRHFSGFDNDVINVKGAKATIEVGRFNENILSPDDDNITYTSTLKSNFYLSSEGVSAINAKGFYMGDPNGRPIDWQTGLADLSNDHLIGLYQGFVSFKENRYDLIVADAFSNDTWAFGTNLTDDTPMGWSAGKGTALDGSGRQAAYIYLEQVTIDGMDDWLWSEEVRHDLERAEQKGVVRVDGTNGYEIYVHLAEIDGYPFDSSIAQKLVDYLNEVNDGVYFSMIDETKLRVQGTVLDGNGDAYFAWDLIEFNQSVSGWDQNIGIIAFSINAPEPATWAMLLLGCGALLYWRRKKA